jgi:hydrogenase maturation factor HypF (carbamoyltransferase family)
MYDGKKDNLLCESCQKEWDELWQKTFHVEIITYPITGPNKPEQMWHDFMAKAKVRVDFT